MSTITEIKLYYPGQFPSKFQLGGEIEGIAAHIIDGCPQVILKINNGQLREITGIPYDAIISQK